MVRYVRTRDSRRVGGPILRFLSISLFSFDSVFLSLLFPFPSVTLSNSFLSLVSHSFSSSLYPSSFLPPLHHSISLSYFLLPSPFRSSTLLFPFSDFLLLSLSLSSLALFPLVLSFPCLPSSLSYSFCPLSRLLSLMSSRGHPCRWETRGSSSKSGQVVPGLG